MDDITTAGQYTLTCATSSEQAHPTSTAQAANGAAPVAQARVFDLTGTSITRIERTTADEYTGPLDELTALGIVREDQLPPKGERKISWLRGERLGRGRCSTDETYVRVWVSPLCAIVGLGVPAATQKMRRRAKRQADAALFSSWDRQWREEKSAAQKVAYANAVESLAKVPRSREAYLRSEAQGARKLMLVTADFAAKGSTCHGFRVSAESMEEIYAAIDGVVEAFMNAQVEFDAQRQAEVIAARQRKILEASPATYDRVKALVKVNPSILQGEAA